MFRSLPPFTQFRAAGGVFENDAILHQSHAIETTDAFRNWTAPDFLDTRCRFTRIVHHHLPAILTAWKEAVAQPKLAIRLGCRELASRCFAACIQIGSGSQRLVGHALAVPHRRDTQQVGVKAGPAFMIKLQHHAARCEIVDAHPLAPCIQDGGKEREIRLNPGRPWLRRIHRLIGWIRGAQADGWQHERDEQNLECHVGAGMGRADQAGQGNHGSDSNAACTPIESMTG